jgi:hypothetical protein
LGVTGHELKIAERNFVVYDVRVLFDVRRLRHRWTAITVQIASTTPNGHVPARKPYALDSAQPPANASTKPLPLRSSAYISIMNVTAQAPKTVSKIHGPRAIRPAVAGG